MPPHAVPFRLIATRDSHIREELALVLAAERAIVRRAVDSAEPIDGGWVLRHPPLPDVWHLNRVHLTGAAPTSLDADGLAALADAHLNGAPHRRVTLDDSAAADRLWPELERRGWRRERAVVMALAADAPRPAADADPRVRSLDEPALRALQPRAFTDDAAVTAISAELPAVLTTAQATLRAGSDTRSLGASMAPDGPAVASATLYLDPDVDDRRVAFVDQVATLRAYRERGLATAVMHAVIATARNWGADTIALFADADDWPQVMYAGIGFRDLGRQVVVHREAD